MKGLCPECETMHKADAPCPPMIDVVAKAIYDVTWEDKWDDLPPDSIERAMGRKQAMAAIDAIQGCVDEVNRIAEELT